MVDNLVGGHRQVVLQLLEEAAHLMLVHVGQAVDELGLHEEDALADVLYVCGRYAGASGSAGFP